MLNRILSFLTLAALPTVAMSEFLWSPVYDSERDAALAALTYVAEVAAKDTEPTEYIGIIYELNGKFLFTAPISGPPDKPVVSDIEWPAQATMAATYHNHVSGQGNEEFSSIDIRTARKLNVPAYLYVADTAEILRWHPDDGRSIHFRRGITNPQTRGEVVALLVFEQLPMSD